MLIPTGRLKDNIRLLSKLETKCSKPFVGKPNELINP